MNKARRHLCFFLLALLVRSLLMSHAVQALPEEEVRFFQVKLQILEPDVTLIEETVEVSIQHGFLDVGIERRLPLSVPGPYGLRNSMNYEILRVLRNDSPEQYTAHFAPVSGTAFAEDLHIATGEPTRVLPKGVHTFKIHYLAFGAIFQSGAHRAMSWRVLDGSLPVKVRELSFEVVANGDSFGTPNLRVFANGYRVDDQRVRLDLSPTRLSLHSEVAIQSRTKLALDLNWVNINEQARTSRSAVTDSPEIIVGLAFALLLLVFFAGRKLMNLARRPQPSADPYPSLIAVGGAELGYLLDKDIHVRSLAAALVSLAWKGHIKVERRNDAFHIVPEVTDGSVLLPYERTLKQSLFADGKRSVLVSTSNRSRFESALRSLRMGVRNQLARRNLLSGLPFILPCLFLFLAGVWCMAVSVPSAWREEVLLYYGLHVLVVLAFILALSCWIPLMKRRGEFRKYLKGDFANWRDYKNPWLLSIVFALLMSNNFLKAYPSGGLWGMILLSLLTWLFWYYLAWTIAEDRVGKQVLFDAYTIKSHGSDAPELQLKEMHPLLFALDIEHIGRFHFQESHSALVGLGLCAGYAPPWYVGEAFEDENAFLMDFNPSFRQALQRACPDMKAMGTQ